MNAKIHRRGLGHMETCKSGGIHAVLNAQNTRWRLGPIQTCNSGCEVAVLNAQIHRWGLGPTETCNSAAKVTVLHEKTTDEGWDQLRLVILVLNTLLCMHSSTDEGLGPIQTCRSGFKVAVLHAQNHRWVLEPIQTCHSGTKHAVLHSQNPQARYGTQGDLQLWCQIRYFECIKPQMRAGTNTDL